MVRPMETGQNKDSVAPDVFLSYRSSDRDRIRAFRASLSKRGVRAFLDYTNLVAGLPWPQALEKALQSVRAVLVFVGAADGGQSLGLWQRREVWFALDRQTQKERQGESFPVIPILLPGSRPDAGFLFLNTWVDLRNFEDETAAAEAVANAIVNVPSQTKDVSRAAVCPYRALEAFREEDAALFFGREAVAEDLLNRVNHCSLVTLVGSSGSGKSSVVQAGLIPLLRRQRPPKRAWDAVVFRLSDVPFNRLASSLIPLLEPEADEIDRLELAGKLGEKLAAGDVRLEDIVDRLIAKSNGTDRLLIVGDQFEELFTQVPSDQRKSFVSLFLNALDRAPFSLLINLRADFYGSAIGLDRRLSDYIQSGLVNLAPMTKEELCLAVEKPAALTEIHFEAGLVDRILDHVEHRPGSLPLLEFALTELWERQEQRSITHAVYEAIDEVEGAISRRAESVFSGLEHKQSLAALHLFARLVRMADPESAEPDTRRRVDLDALTEAERGVLQPFVAARLLVLDRDQAAGTQIVELAHEALIHGWHRLGEWINQHREFLLWRQRLERSLAEWRRNARDKSMLLRGPALKEAVRWAQNRKTELTHQETEFIRLSRGKRRRRQYVLGTLAAVTVLMVAAWPTIEVATRTNAFQVWLSVHVAPVVLRNVRPSVSAAWVHAVDVAGYLDKIGWKIFNFPPAVTRSIALSRAAVILAEQERTEEAQRLADQAFELAKQAEDFETNAGAQIFLARIAHEVGRMDAAQGFARSALALADQQRDPEPRAVALASVAMPLARVGLENEAKTAIERARASIPPYALPASRAAIDVASAIVLVYRGLVDEALALHQDPSGLVPVLEALVDKGYLTNALEMVDQSDNPFASAIVASALLSADRKTEAVALARKAVALLEKAPMGDDTRDQWRAYFQERLLLKAMTVDEAAAFVRGRRIPEELASLAAVLARLHQTALAIQLAREAAGKVQAISENYGRSRVLEKVVVALARSGETEQALSMARNIEERNRQIFALAHAALGFAGNDQEERAESLLREIDEALSSIKDPYHQSAIWRTVALTNIRLGRYASASDSEGMTTHPDDIVSVHTSMIRDDALRRNPDLHLRFTQGPIDGFGKSGVHWP